MQKTLTYLVVVLAAWAWLELQTQGTQGAFGGRVARFFTPVESVRGEPELPPRITEQVRQRVEGVMAQSERDRERRMGDLR